MFKHSYKKIMASPFNLIKKKLETIEISQKETAERIVNLIPNTCPFAREIRCFNRIIFKIPPLCKLNPFYEDLMMLRFRALSFLGEIGEDITPYCH
jgi:hypothetical protein